MRDLEVRVQGLSDFRKNLLQRSFEVKVRGEGIGSMELEIRGSEFRGWESRAESGGFRVQGLEIRVVGCRVAGSGSSHKGPARVIFLP